MEESNTKLYARDAINTTKLIAGGFLTVIIIGTFLLALPVSSASGEWTPVIDAMFTTVTSVCVTGLVTVTTASHWSLFGHVVILLLIQLGGLGVVCCGVTVLMIVKRRISLREQMVVQESYGLDEYLNREGVEHGIGKVWSGYDGLIKRIVRGTLIVEGIGAICYAFVFVPDFGWGTGIWYSVFHSVSAFCNAGLDIIGDYSLVPYRTNIIVNLTTIGLIVTGGIGFIVWWDIVGVVKDAIRTKQPKNMLFKRLTLHSKIAIITTGILIITGTILIFIFEYNNPATIGNETIGGKVLMALFQSVTTRTAGYFTMMQDGLRDTTYIVTVLLMLIGGSPMGTAGGLKTTTIAMVCICAYSVIKGKKDAEVLGRRISSENIRTGMTVICISISALLVGIMLLCIIEPFSMRDIVYESVSAIATVGLGVGMSPLLSWPGKFILILLMYIGRVGPITLAMVFAKKRSAALDGIELAEKKIIIG